MTAQEIASASAVLKQELAPIFEKIGQGAEWTFEIFVRQAYAQALMNLLWIVPGIAAFVASSKFWAWLKKDEYRDGEQEFLASAAAVLLFMLGLLFVLLPIAGLIQVLVNPEYAAIKLIIETFKGE